jgi:radical SAM superfamily enzyme YgiQ (UPF0313 family)
MHVVLWDTRKAEITKDFAGGLGVGMYHGGGGLRGRLVRRFFTRDCRPVALNFAYMAALFKKLGHTVEFCEDTVAAGADLYVFNPAMGSLSREREAIGRARALAPRSKILVVGALAHAVPEAFADLDVTIVRGEPEQLYWKLDDVLNAEEPIVNIGTVADLDEVPWPDWSPFRPHRFRIAYDFWQFPTGLVYQSRGCNLSCNYCPYIILQNKTRFRDPDRIVAEIQYGMRQYGFRSFKFRDPLFGLDRKRVLRLAEGLARLPQKIQFSIESRLDLLKPEILQELKRAGLTSITIGIERPDEETLRRYKRAPIKEDRQLEFIERCRRLGIRTVAGFMVGFPDDTRDSILGVLKHARRLNPTFANFNVVTPYPGTEFYDQVKDQVGDFDLNKYNVYTPVMKYQHLTPDQVAQLHETCFGKYYFRSKYYRLNLHLLFPVLQRFGLGLKHETLSAPPREARKSGEPSGVLPVIQNNMEKAASPSTGTGEGNQDRQAAA